MVVGVVVFLLVMMVVMVVVQVVVSAVAGGSLVVRLSCPPSVACRLLLRATGLR